ncbi:glycosyltransferase family A protein [Flavivirga sp. 57AJ16]|uniref:glycosyltransferase family 2 protein n=1 Tax=Flavivirga sp. 57AJ16 TaxID=3025307 RepID=UPI0023658B0E|nr:glycosyltransferase family A protein [Flavivirga sp. 57AJ16]MDD7885185.1 glycosyltransferase family A protein [Flavivirga sp. 57AJ16]
MSNMPLVAIIVPCYNQASFLSESLRSVYNQTFKNWECIIVNDGSLDNTEETASAWVQKDARFKYVLKTNGGLSSARNKGIGLSSAKYIFPFDADDKLHETYLEKAVNILEKNNNIEVLSSKVQFFGVKDDIYQLPDYTFETLLLKNCFIACSIFKRASYIKVGGYDENLKSFEDWDFWISILKYGGEAHVIDEVLYYYRKHKANSLSNRFYTDGEFYYSLYNYVYKKHIDLYLNAFPNFIFVYKDYLKFKAFNEKVKRNIFFKTYNQLKKILKK